MVQWKYYVEWMQPYCLLISSTIGFMFIFLPTIASKFFQVVFVCKYQMSKERLLFSPFPLLLGRQRLGVGRKRIESHFNFSNQERYTYKWFLYGITLSKETELLWVSWDPSTNYVLSEGHSFTMQLRFCWSNAQDWIWRLINGTINITCLELGLFHKWEDLEFFLFCDNSGLRFISLDWAFIMILDKKGPSSCTCSVIVLQKNANFYLPIQMCCPCYVPTFTLNFSFPMLLTQNQNS